MKRRGRAVLVRSAKSKKFFTSLPGTAKSSLSSRMLHPINRMNSLRYSASLFGVAFVLASCGEPERAKPVAVTGRAARAGSDFDAIGTVTLYPGESCASQIVFVFHTARSTSISMAAPWRESKILTNAVREHRTVRVIGKWRRGKSPDCSYIEATQVEIQKSFW
jgi:hypothetical protein